MGFFSKLFGGGQNGGGRFQTEEAHTENRVRQLAMTPMTMAQLRKFGVADDGELKLEYFFYTNTEQKADALAQELAGLGYTGNFERSAANKKQFVVTGWTSKMKMDEQTVLGWTGQMCDMAYKHDCEFDGWGTNPKQACA